MKTIYSICFKYDDNGWYNSDKHFQTPELANTYLRKLAADTIKCFRQRGFIIKYINVSFNKNDPAFPAVIELGVFNILGWKRFDMRVKTSVLFESKDEFNKYPIQF